MTSKILMNRTHGRRVFHEVTCPPGYAVRHAANDAGFEFYPYKSHSAQMRDAASISEHSKQTRALSPAALRTITAEMRKIGARILALAAKRRAPLPMPQPMEGFSPAGEKVAPTHDALPRCACGRAPSCLCEGGSLAAVPYPIMSIPKKGDAMFRAINPSLAPTRNITFDKPTTRDQKSFGERLQSRFASAENERLSYSLPAGSAGLASLAEMNEANKRAHNGGASGQMRDDSQETRAYAQQARGGVAPAATPYTTVGTAAGEGGRVGASGMNKRSGMIEALSNDPTQGFANMLNAIPNGEPQAALNAYHSAYHAAKTPGARDAVDRIWASYQRR